MIYLPHILLIGFNVANALIDAYKIKVLHKEIRHAINLGAYLALAGVIIWLFQMNPSRSIVFLFSAFFGRQITFDIPLNLRRGLKWDYVSLARPPKSWWDRVEIRIFGYNGRLPVLVYGTGWLITLIIYYSL